MIVENAFATLFVDQLLMCIIGYNNYRTNRIFVSMRLIL